MSPGAPDKRPSSIWTRAQAGREAAAGYDLAANVMVGLGLGWLAQRFWPGLHPWGYVGGLLLGAASGFYQLFKQHGRPKRPRDADQDHA